MGGHKNKIMKFSETTMQEITCIGFGSYEKKLSWPGVSSWMKAASMIHTSLV